LTINRLTLVNMRSKTGSVPVSDIDVRSCNYCSSGKKRRITYSECVFV